MSVDKTPFACLTNDNNCSYILLTSSSTTTTKKELKGKWRNNGTFCINVFRCVRTMDQVQIRNDHAPIQEKPQPLSCWPALNNENACIDHVHMNLSEKGRWGWWCDMRTLVTSQVEWKWSKGN